jgi:hypothetical protein
MSPVQNRRTEEQTVRPNLTTMSAIIEALAAMTLFHLACIHACKIGLLT